MPKGAVAPHEVTDLVTDLRSLAGRFDPDQLDIDAIPGVLADLGQAVRLVEGMVTLLAAPQPLANAADGAHLTLTDGRTLTYLPGPANPGSRNPRTRQHLLSRRRTIRHHGWTTRPRT